MIKWARAQASKMLVSSGAASRGELSGVARFLSTVPDRADGLDDPTVLTACPALQPGADDVDEGATIISPIPLFDVPAENADSAPATDRSGAAVAPSRPSAASAVSVDIDKIWPAQPPARQREIPRKAIAVAAGLLVLIVLTLLCSRAAHQPATAIGENRDDGDVSRELVVSEKDLKHRVQVTADYFRSRRAVSVSTPSGSAAATPVPPPVPADEEEDRGSDRRRRDDDPEDLVTHRHRRPLTAASDIGKEPKPADDHRRPFLYYPAPPPFGGAKPASSATGAGSTIAPAGTVVSASLVTPINLPANGGTASVIAKVDGDGPLPRGTRIVGSASAEDGSRLTVRFSRLLLPDNREAKFDAEAQDQSGAFGVDAVLEANRGARARGVAGDIAAGAAADGADAVLSTFTGGIAGGILRNAADRASSRGSSSSDESNSAARLTLAAGTQFNVFFHEAAVERR